MAALQLKDFDSELDALTEYVAPERRGPAGPVHRLGRNASGRRGDDRTSGTAWSRPAGRGRRGRRGRGCGVVLLGLAVAASSHLRETPVEAVTPPTRLRAGPATFRVEAEPSGARVWVDEVEVGAAPIALPVSGGRHKVRVAVDGYAPAELSLDIAAGTAPAPLRFVLEPVTVRLSVTSEPAGATVRLDGKSIGVAPIERRDVPPGRHEVRIEKKGFVPFVQRIDGARRRSRWRSTPA